MAVKLRKSLIPRAGNGRPREIVMSAAAKQRAATTECGTSIDRQYALIMIVLIVVMSGCRALPLIPHNHTCPYANPLFHSTVPLSAQVTAIRRQVPPPPRIPSPMTPYGPPRNLPPVVPQVLPPITRHITQPIPPQGSPPVPVEDVVVAPPSTIVQTLLALRQEMQELRNDNTDLTKKLETIQEGTEQRARLNQRTTILMKNVRNDLSSVQSELNAWRSDLSTLRGRVRDQHTHQERTLVDVEKQLYDMISLFEDTESDSGE